MSHNFHRNATDYCMKWLWWCYIKDRDSRFLQNQVNFSFIIVLRVKQDINPAVTLNNIFIRSKTSLFSANDTSAHLGKKYDVGDLSGFILMDYFLSCLSTRIKRGEMEQPCVLWFSLSILSALNVLTIC